MEGWLTDRAVLHRRLYHDAGDLVEILGGRPGQWWALDACVDTAPYGDETAWSFPPDSGEVRQGWLLGRGSADSKLAAAIFCPEPLNCTAGSPCCWMSTSTPAVSVVPAPTWPTRPRPGRPAGVMIGYPGLDEVVVGGRGLWRAAVAVHAPSGHSGSSRTVVGAISHAAHLVRLLDAANLPGVDSGQGFPLPPKLSVTSFHGGQGFSVTADLCELNVDIRTTSTFDAHDAETLMRKAVAELDTELPVPKSTEILPVASWPPFRLREDEQPAAVLPTAAEAGLAVRAKTAGPSNIGNLLAGEGIPATAGFGLPYEGLHGIDERASRSPKGP
ncbi:peptidase dimerization domain-containing protein [Streptomyces klenkii]|uniref:peptidase dimerization domain-containing protein n=1 Tax=Streptomyces klenkii TaxID=1420899 RepID=UPI003F4C6E1E